MSEWRDAANQGQRFRTRRYIPSVHMYPEQGVVITDEATGTEYGPMFEGTANGLLGLINNLEHYKALADHVAEPLRAFVPVTASQPDIDAFRKPWLADYDALKAQEAGQ